MCTLLYIKFLLHISVYEHFNLIKRYCYGLSKIDFLILILLQPDVVNHLYFKLSVILLKLSQFCIEQGYFTRDIGIITLEFVASVEFLCEHLNIAIDMFYANTFEFHNISLQKITDRIQYISLFSIKNVAQQYVYTDGLKHQQNYFFIQIHSSLWLAEKSHHSVHGLEIQLMSTWNLDRPGSSPFNTQPGEQSKF